jgi:MYXO-CTERM domain-containing protein
MHRTSKYLIAGAALALALVAEPSVAQACGGFFCSAAQPVNQAAERIVFADNGDGTVTAVIQIMYEGPSESFSWLLPISSVPQGDDIAVASDIAFQRLQSATNPQYTLTTRVEGTCKNGDPDFGGGRSGAGGSSQGGGPTIGPGGNDGGVTVVGSGVVGAFEWTVISIDESLPEPADVAVTWLGENGYDVPAGAAALLGPYLEEGLYLLALRLTKGSDVGSIRPIVLTYEASRPMIPIKLTAVAANDDMGVMTWLLGSGRGIPQNYLALELNEARLNWFNPSLNYNDVVTAAADDAQGQGFVTEFAGPSSTLATAVWSQYDDQMWQSFSTGVYSSFNEIFSTANSFYGTWDGFWDAVRATVTLPAGLAFEDFQVCPNCYSGQITFSPAAFIAALEDSVIEPVRLVQDLIDEHPNVTRLYSTLSAAEMTVDPLFAYNADLEDVSNVHTAERIIECNPDVFEFEAPWRIELPQGGVVRGTADQVGTWPAEFSDQPANFRILRQAESGEGRVVEDNGPTINDMLDTYNGDYPPYRGGGSDSSDSGGCNVAHPTTTRAAWALLAFGLAALGGRRRRRTRI